MGSLMHLGRYIVDLVLIIWVGVLAVVIFAGLWRTLRLMLRQDVNAKLSRTELDRPKIHY